MITTQSKNLKVGDRVMWENDPTDLGTVIDHNEFSVTVQWEKAGTGFGIIDHRDAQSLSEAV